LVVEAPDTTAAGAATLAVQAQGYDLEDAPAEDILVAEVVPVAEVVLVAEAVVPVAEVDIPEEAVVPAAAVIQAVADLDNIGRATFLTEP
jgi:hypothetical protein